MSSRRIALSILLAAGPAPAALAWDPVRDITGKPLHEHVEHGAKELGNLPGSLERCARDVGECVDRNVKRIPYTAVWPVIERYKNHLRAEARGKWRRLPPALVREARPYYSDIDLGQVRYAEDVNTIHGQALTWHYEIFFPGRIDLDPRRDLELMLHELEHTVQYERRGGEREFLGEYILKAPGKVVERRSFDVHDHIDIERAADAKAERVLAALTDRSAASPRGTFPVSRSLLVGQTRPLCQALSCGYTLPVG